MSKRLILLVSGWNKSDWLWDSFMNRAVDNGFDVLRLSIEGRGYGDITKYAEAAQPLLTAVRPIYEHITIVGHSMGGLIARRIIQLSPLSNHIDAYVSIATPHQGSWLSWLAPWSKSACQMRPGSAFLSELDAAQWPDIPTLALRASSDPIVPNASFSKANENITIPWTTHVSVLLSPKTFWEIYSWLTFDVLGEGPALKKGHGSVVNITT